MRHKSITHIIKENKKPKYKYNRNKKVNRTIVTSGEPLHWTSTKQKKRYASVEIELTIFSKNLVPWFLDIQHNIL